MHQSRELETIKYTESQAAVSRNVAEVQAKLEVYSEEQRAIVAENMVFRKLLTDAEVSSGGTICVKYRGPR